ncbi:reverse transcriptase domain-containing protein [Tanacetum coccineum]
MSIKGKILADFIVERPEDDPPDTPMEDKEELPDLWVHVHERLIVHRRLRSWPNNYEFGKNGIHICFEVQARAIRRKASGYAVTNGTLYKRSFLRPWLRCVGPLHANYVLREIHEGSCNMHAGLRSVVEKALRPGNPQQKLTPITSPWPFYKWGIDIAGPFPEGPGEIISDNEKQFRDNPFKDWCEKLCIRQFFASVKYSQANGLVERANKSLGEGIKARLDLLEEKREQAAIQEAKSKAMMEKYYNTRVRNTSFCPGDLVYRNNEASHAEDGGKLGPKWEGPYEVTEALGKGAYKLRDRNGNTLTRTWNVCNLKKCYVHEM